MKTTLRIWMVDSFYTGSHKQWMLAYQKHSHHHIQIFSLPGRHWKYRMQAAAYTLAQQLNACSHLPDYILISDMVNGAELKGFLKPQLRAIPIGLYMHENQISYPWSPEDPDIQYRQDRTYGLINIKSYLAADRVFYNSRYHKESFDSQGRKFLEAFPDQDLLKAFIKQESKSFILPIGLELPPLRQKRTRNFSDPVIIWNHRWEYDKNPEAFFSILRELKAEGYAFKLIICGTKHKKYPKVFDEARNYFEDEIIHWGYAESRQEYFELLNAADMSLVTAHQDFFGISVVESLAAGILTILPLRLAYPEHIPKEYHKDCFYRSKREALDLMKKSIKKNFTLPKGIQKHIRQYDWSQMAQVYDSTIAEAVGKITD